LLFILINMLLVTPFAANPIANTDAIIGFCKIVILYYLIAMTIHTKLHYRMFIWFQIWGNYLLGYLSYTEGEFSGGRLENIGAPGIKESNLLALHFLLILPFLGMKILRGNKWERIASIITSVFVVNAIILCNSRGAYLSMALMCVFALIMFGSKFRLKIIIGICIGGLLFFQLTDNKFWDRMSMSEIKTTNEDGSAMGRMKSWNGAIDMIFDFPFGKGGGGWEEYSPRYIPDIVYAHGGQKRSVHNTYLMMATDWGIQGLILFLFFLSGSLFCLYRIRLKANQSPDDFYYIESTAMFIAIAGFLIGSFFLNRIYAESLYWYCALAAALSNIQNREISQMNSVPSDE
jgi:putative inorganic carbon (HCO3(-)) transporter